MSELVRCCGHESRDSHIFVSNHYTKNLELNGYHSPARYDDCREGLKIEKKGARI